MHFFNLLKALIDKNLENFVFNEIFNEESYKYQSTMMDFSDFYKQTILAGENIYPNYWLDYDSLPSLEKISDEINPFHVTEEIINKTINDLKNFYKNKENINNERYQIMLSNVKNKLISEYNHKLMSLSIFEFLGYCFLKKKYHYKIIHYRYTHPNETSIPIFLPNHHFEAFEQQKLFLFLAFNYFEETEFNRYIKPNYLIDFTIVYLIYCQNQISYSKNGRDNRWDNFIINNQNLKEALNLVS